MEFRAATPADADAIAQVVAEGFESYRSFAGERWSPPDPLELAMGLVMRLGAPSIYCVVAEEHGAIAGQVAFMPAADHSQPVDDPELAHLFQLFARPQYQGTGLATQLHTMAIEEAARRGFTAMRLFTPAGQQRARRFYEREGWEVAAAPYFEEALDLEIVEYRRPVP
jgi:GNAT superfamily N-acetyltransferase